MNDWKLVNSKDVSIYDDFAEIYNLDEKNHMKLKLFTIVDLTATSEFK